MLRHSRMIRQLPDECLVRSTRFILKIIMDLKNFCRYFISLKRSNKTKQSKTNELDAFFRLWFNQRGLRWTLSLSLSHSLLHAHTHFFANNAHTNTHANSLLSPNTNVFFSLGKLTLSISLTRTYVHFISSLSFSLIQTMFVFQCISLSSIVS